MGEPEASNVLTISQFPQGIDEKMVRQVLSPYGTIKTILMQSAARAARITFMDAGEAKWIRENLDGNIPEGLTEPVNVRYAAAPAAPKPAAAAAGGGWQSGGGGAAGKGFQPYGGGGGGWGGGGGMGGGMGGAINTIKNGLRWVLPGSNWQVGDPEIYIGGLPPDTTDVDLYEIFAPFGAIPPRGVKAMLNPEGQCTGIGFVNFVHLADAQKAKETLNGTMLPNGQWLKVDLGRKVKQ